MGIPAHIARLRAVVGHDLLLLPSVSVLPVGRDGRLLLVRHAGHDDGWGVLGGAIEVGENGGISVVACAARTVSAVRRRHRGAGQQGSVAGVRRDGRRTAPRRYL